MIKGRENTPPEDMQLVQCRTVFHTPPAANPERVSEKRLGSAKFFSVAWGTVQLSFLQGVQLARETK